MKLLLRPGHSLLYGTKSREDNSKQKTQELSSLFMTYGLGVMVRTRLTIWN